MKSLTGQYEYVHRSGLGLDYFTSRVNRLTLYDTGRFSLITQERSRIAHAAKSLAAGQQASMEAPEERQEGSYTSQSDQLSLRFDDGGQEQAQIMDQGLQFGKDYFEKVSDSTFMPPPQRLKSNMEDIAKGLKIAGTIGNTVMKAARTFQDTMQTQSPQTQQGAPSSAQQPAASNNAPGTGNQSYNAPNQGNQSYANAAGNQPYNAPNQSGQPYNAPNQGNQSYANAARTPAPGYTGSSEEETVFCDQCGSPVRAGKKFCNTCGARLA